MLDHLVVSPNADKRHLLNQVNPGRMTGLNICKCIHIDFPIGKFMASLTQTDNTRLPQNVLIREP